MPTKGRKGPCHDPMARGHSRNAQFREVVTCQEGVLGTLRRLLPEHEWKTGTRMCGACRAAAYKQAKARQIAHNVLNNLLGGCGDFHDDLTDNDMEVDNSQPFQLTDAPVSNEIEQVGLPKDAVNTGAPLFSPMEESAPFHQINGSEPSAPPENLLTPELQPPFFLHPPAIASTSRGPPSPVKKTTQFGSPRISVSSSVFSDPNDPLFRSPEAAKHDLYQFLHSLGIQTPDKSDKSKKSRIRNLMVKASTAMKSLFKNYTGESPDLHSEPGSCKHCRMLCNAVRDKLNLFHQKKERYMMLTALPNNLNISQIHEKIGVSVYVARLVSSLRSTEGPFSFPEWKPSGHPLNDEIRTAVIDFYLADDNSRVSPNARDTINIYLEDGSKERVPKRFMLTNLRDAFVEFKRLNPEKKIGISKFAELRPKNCRWPGSFGVYNSCACIIHENMKFMLEGLKNASLDGIAEQFQSRPSTVSYVALMEDYKELIDYIICSPASEDCYLGFCSKCPIDVQYEELFEFSEGSSITYKSWQGNNIVTITEDHNSFKEKFMIAFSKFLMHQYTYEMQKRYINQLKAGLSQDQTSCVLTVDFGENYAFVVQDAIQGYHWNNAQATIHPFVLYVASPVDGQAIYKTYFVISNDLKHDASSFHAFKVRVIEKVKIDYPFLKIVDYVSDGAGSQYKNKYNISNLVHHEDDFNLKARWHNTATGHGKSTCDAMSAIVKRKIRLLSLTGEMIITTPEEMFRIASRELTSPTLEFIYVTAEDTAYWREKLQDRYNQTLSVPSIQQCHFFSVGNNRELVYKRNGYSERCKRIQLIKQTDLDENEMEYEENQQQTASIGEFYAIRVGNGYQIGQVISSNEEDKSFSFRMMKKTGRGGIALLWPDIEKIQEFGYNDLITKVKIPAYSEELHNYRLSPDDLKTVRA